MPILTPPPACADDHDKATIVKARTTNKNAFAFMTDSPAKRAIRTTFFLRVEAELDRTDSQ